MNDAGKTMLGAVFVVALFVSAVLFAGYIETNENVQLLISSFGPLGILIVSLIGGLNLIVPLPATAFIPVFLASGFNIWVIVSIIVIGTTIADLLSYYVGTIIKKNKAVQKNRVYRTLQKWCLGKPLATMLVVFTYASVVPLPNEVLLLPLGALGVRIQSLVPAFILGNIVHVSLVAFGFSFVV